MAQNNRQVCHQGSKPQNKKPRPREAAPKGREATAAYNFVALPREMLVSELEQWNQADAEGKKCTCRIRNAGRSIVTICCKRAITAVPSNWKSRHSRLVSSVCRRRVSAFSHRWIMYRSCRAAHCEAWSRIFSRLSPLAPCAAMRISMMYICISAA